MPTLLSSLADNLSEERYRDEYTDSKSCLDYKVFKNDQLIIRCFNCKRNCKKFFNKKLVKRFAKIYKFCYGDINKFILLLKKGVYPYEYMNSWETSLPDKEDFNSKVNM